MSLLTGFTKYGEPSLIEDALMWPFSQRPGHWAVNGVVGNCRHEVQLF